LNWHSHSLLFKYNKLLYVSPLSDHLPYHATSGYHVFNILYLDCKVKVLKTQRDVTSEDFGFQTYSKKLGSSTST